MPKTIKDTKKVKEVKPKMTNAELRRYVEVMYEVTKKVSLPKKVHDDLLEIAKTLASQFVDDEDEK